MISSGVEGKCATFQETGKTVCDRFHGYWQQNGGLRQFGYPVSHPFTEVSKLNGQQYLVQYFERAIFELHPENKPPNDVLLAQLGTLAFQNGHAGVEPNAPYIANLPIYAGAREIKVVRGPSSGVQEDNVTTYIADAEPAAVLAFYKRVLLANGWQLGERQFPDAVEFIYDRGSGPLYSIGVFAKQIEAAQTSVRTYLIITGTPARSRLC
jgi:nitrogen fixation protein